MSGCRQRAAAAHAAGLPTSSWVWAGALAAAGGAWHTGLGAGPRRGAMRGAGRRCRAAACGRVWRPAVSMLVDQGFKPRGWGPGASGAALRAAKR